MKSYMYGGFNNSAGQLEWEPMLGEAWLIFDPLDESETLPDHYSVVGITKLGSWHWESETVAGTDSWQPGKKIVVRIRSPRLKYRELRPVCYSVAELKRLEANDFMDILGAL